ncbi:MAG: Ppx/GppA family phosphatase [Hydrogenophilaceae bacterium]|nr:Ppx/GppA family phosphatase [Hydrogenophilaceae bacterium]
MSDPARLDLAAAPAAARAHDGAVAAVIDIGSNSVRLVIYRIEGRAPIPILNEKVMAGLGRDMPRTRRLSAPGAESALRALRRFAAILDSVKPHALEVVATAAVREAEDGAAFAERVRRETGLKLRILSGEEEARISALGVLGAKPDARGVVGDLGGSSLELVEVAEGRLLPGESFSVGPLALMRGEGFDPVRAGAAIETALAGARALRGQGGDFYAVGGAWRAIGRIDIAVKQHPLHILQHYEMSRAEALKIAEFVRKQSRRSLERLEEAAAKRADLLPYAAVALEHILERGRFERVILSSFGLREGLLFDAMPPASLREHILIAGAEAFAAPTPAIRAFVRALGPWIEPALASEPPVFAPDHDALLREAAARMADLGGMLHPDQRDELIFDLVVRAPLAGVTHRERAFLAACVHHRYTKRPPPAHAIAYTALLSEEERRAAATVGAALRLGCDAAGRTQDLLSRFTLKREAGALVLATKASDAYLVGEQAERRLDSLGALLGLPVRVAAGPKAEV